MPLTDFVRYLNAQLPFSHAGLNIASPFVATRDGVQVDFGGLRLTSSFTPIVDRTNGETRGHAAILRSVDRKTRRHIASDTIFTLPTNATDFIFLDRLVRTLHTLNYLIYGARQSDGLLLLKVHPQHVASVHAGHGLAFEEILRGCGLLPKQITLELELDGQNDHAHFRQAVGNYQARGYGIAISTNQAEAFDPATVHAVRPNLLKLTLRAEESPPRGGLAGLIDSLSHTDTRLLVDGDERSIAHAYGAALKGADLLTLHTAQTLLEPTQRGRALYSKAA